LPGLVPENGGWVSFECDGVREGIRDLLALGVEVHELNVEPPGLEQVFVELARRAAAPVSGVHVSAERTASRWPAARSARAAGERR
jgi:hypothetical protein